VATAVSVANADDSILVKPCTGGQQEEIFTIAISSADLANMVGTATESVIRILSDIKEEKAVDINGSKITLLDP